MLTVALLGGCGADGNANKAGGGEVGADGYPTSSEGSADATRDGSVGATANDGSASDSGRPFRDGGDTGGMGGPGATADAGATMARARVDSLELPADFDVDLCRDVRLDPDGDERVQVGRCAECCARRAYTLARFVLDDSCVCSRRPSFTDAQRCADQDGSAAGCRECCTTEGFDAGDAEDGSCVCSRQPREDTELCADTLDTQAPDEACEACCLEKGFFGFMHSDLPTLRQCRCIESG
ncbi:MAG: hypothetical protein PVI30_15990 [Myxococcales bacterium]